MRSEIVKLTPVMAKSLLEINTSNRKIRPSHIKSMAEAMRRGEWILSPQGIAISNENVILDGQNRMLAVIASGVSVPMLVWHDVDPLVFPILDRGIPRTLGDATKLPHRHAAILTFFYYCSKGQSRKPTPQEAIEIDDVFNRHISELLVFAPKVTKTFSQVGLMAAAVFASYNGERDWAFDLYRRLTLGDTEGLPPVAAVIVKQALNGSLFRGTAGGEAQMQVFTKGLIVFSEKNRDKRFLTYTDATRDASREMVTKAIYQASYCGTKRKN